VRNSIKIRIGNIEGYCHISGEVEISKCGVSGFSGVSGKSEKGNLSHLRQIWGCLLSWAKAHNIKRLYCEPTLEDGRGKTRCHVYSRVGFYFVNNIMMVYDLEKEDIHHGKEVQAG
jgi:hypothetical protein